MEVKHLVFILGAAIILDRWREPEEGERDRWKLQSRKRILSSSETALRTDKSSMGVA